MFVFNDEPHGTGRHSVFVGQRLHATATGRVAAANLLGLGIRQLGFDVALATGRVCAEWQIVCASVAALASPIALVVKRCSGEKVGRIYARSVVAVMADVHAAWNRAVCQMVGVAMRHPSLVSLPSSDPHAEHAVSTDITRPGPAPTLRFRASGYARPESNNRIANGIRHSPILSLEIA